MAESMLANLLKTPQQVRQEQEVKLRQEAMQRASAIKAPQGASTALPGIFASLARQQTVAGANDMNTIARGLGQGAGGLLQAAGAPEELSRAVGQLGTTSEERRAAQTQGVMSDYKPGNLQSMKATYQMLKDQGAPAGALIQIAGQIQKQEALVREKLKKEKGDQAAYRYVYNYSPEVAELLANGGIEKKDAVDIVRKGQEPMIVGDSLLVKDPKTGNFEVKFAPPPKPGATYTLLTNAEKKAQNLPTEVQYQKNSVTGKVEALKGAPRPTDLNAPTGYQYTYEVGPDGKSRITGATVIPGTPQADELEAQKKVVQQGFKNKGSVVNIVTPAVDSAINIVKNPDSWTTGKGGAFVEAIGKATGGVASANTPRLALQETINTIKANVGFDKLQAMRDASPTGGALGQVSNIELRQLEASLGSLNPNQDKETLLKNLNTVKAQYISAGTAIANDLTDQQLIQAGLAQFIPFRTATKNEDGTYTQLEEKATPDKPSTSASTGTFNLNNLPEEVQNAWGQFTDAEKRSFGWTG